MRFIIAFCSMMMFFSVSQYTGYIVTKGSLQLWLLVLIYGLVLDTIELFNKPN